MAEEPGGPDESPDDAPPSSPDSDASHPGDEADDTSADASDADGPSDADGHPTDGDGETPDDIDGDPSVDADGEDADATDVEPSEADDGDDLTPAVREVSDGADSADGDGPIPAVRAVDDGDVADGADDGDDADSRTEVEYDASEAEELFSIPDPEDADDGDGDESADDQSGDDGPSLEDAYPDQDEIETPPARDEHGSDGDDGEPEYETVDDDMDAPLAGEAAREAADAPASDGGYADEVGGSNEYGHTHDEIYDDVYDDEEWEPEGAPDDEEMPLADHIEEMVRRLGVVVVVMAVVSGVVFPFAENLINFLWFSYLPGELVQCPGEATTAAASSENPGPPYCARVYHPLGLILARLKVATLVGFIVALPVFVYETYLFMRPGLYPHERRYYLASVPTSTVLAGVGVAFAHFLVIPAIFTYFLRYSEQAAGIAFGLTETFDLMVLLMGGFAIVFQIPLFIMLALMMDLVTRKWLHDRRLLFWGAFAGIAFLFSPDPTGMAPIIVAVTMIVLFEGTLYLAKWTGRG